MRDECDRTADQFPLTRTRAWRRREPVGRFHARVCAGLSRARNRLDDFQFSIHGTEAETAGCKRETRELLSRSDRCRAEARQAEKESAGDWWQIDGWPDRFASRRC